MQYSASDFRTMARERLRGKWWTAILLTVIASILGVATTASSLIEIKFESETGVVVGLLYWLRISKQQGHFSIRTYLTMV